jgi:FO synthase subunit 1
VVLLEKEKMLKIIEKAIQFKCKESLIMSGEKPDNFIEVKEELIRRDYNSYIEFVKDISKNLLGLHILPHTNIGLLTFEEMEQLKNYNASMGLMIESTCMDLFKKGNVHEKSPGKIPQRRIEHIMNAGKLKIPFTTGLLLGIGETFEDRIKDLYLIKKIHSMYGHIQEVILQNFVNKNGISYQPKKTLKIKDFLRIVGIAKIILKNEIAIQVPPNLISGNEKDFIDMGLDDFGGISPITLDYINPNNLWPQIDDLRKICQNKGYKMKERLAIYDIFIKKKGFCPESIKKTIDNIDIDDK